MSVRLRWLMAAAWASSGLAACGGRTPEPASAAQPAAVLSASDIAQVRAFAGPDGMRVEVVDLSDSGALVRASGVTSEAAGTVVRCEREQDGPYLRYRTTYHGRDWNIVVRRESSAGDAAWTAYLPGASANGFPLQYSQEASADVDPSGLYREHLAQAERGELEVLARFDRRAEEQDEQAELDQETARTAEACGAPLRFGVVWDTVRDEQLKEKSISSYCGSVLSGLRNVCRFQAGKAFVKAQVKTVRCRLDGSAELTLADGTLSWAIGFETYNLADRAREALHATKPDAANASLGEQILADQTSVCADEHGEHVVLIGPQETPFGGLAYGDGSTFYRIATPPMLGQGWFFDPRQRNERHNDNFRGYDLRVYSFVEPSPAQGTCKLVCGTRETQLSLVTTQAKATLLAKANYQPSPHGREPYAIARDKQGTYYYVDRGATPETAKDFRLYRGKRGQLRRLAMRDVVSDSEGEIFQSDRGRLRLLLGRGDAEWIEKSHARKLLRLSLQENYGLIYNELGVYLGQRLGVPCDDF